MENANGIMRDFVFYLVDDDEDDQELFKTALSEIDKSVSYLGYTKSELFLKSLDNCNQLPDMIFLDLYMPIIDGEECLIELRKIMKFNDVPVIIYSSEIEPGRLGDLLSIGANGYLKKSENYSELLTSLGTIQNELIRNQY